MEAIIGKILSDLGTFLFGPIMLAVFFGVGLYFTIRLKGIQFTRFGTTFREVVWNVEKKSDEGIGQIRSYKALATALSSCVGNGNIVGVAGATMSVAIRRGVQRGVFSNEAGTGSRHGQGGRSRQAGALRHHRGLFRYLRHQHLNCAYYPGPGFCPHPQHMLEGIGESVSWVAGVLRE